MKKAIAVLICFCWVLSIGSVYAEVGFSKMTDEELISAQEELQNELLNRGLIKKVTLPAGLYEAGVDIPVGKYIVTAATVNQAKYPCVSVYKDKKDASSLFSLNTLSEQVLADYGSCMVTLEEGQVLKLESVSFTVEKYNIASF